MIGNTFDRHLTPLFEYLVISRPISHELDLTLLLQRKYTLREAVYLCLLQFYWLDLTVTSILFLTISG